nr:unnamed protein product [Digitaria exilis]
MQATGEADAATAAGVDGALLASCVPNIVGTGPRVAPANSWVRSWVLGSSSPAAAALPCSCPAAVGEAAGGCSSAMCGVSDDRSLCFK